MGILSPLQGHIVLMLHILQEPEWKERSGGRVPLSGREVAEV